MQMRIDEAGHHQLARALEDGRALRHSEACADGLDAVALDMDVAGEGRAPLRAAHRQHGGVADEDRHRITPWFVQTGSTRQEETLAVWPSGDHRLADSERHAFHVMQRALYAQ